MLMPGNCRNHEGGIYLVAVALLSWHPIGTPPETVNAAELLQKRGVIEIREAENQYRLKPKS
jgi:hypothetical protein